MKSSVNVQPGERHRTTVYLEQDDLACLDELKAYYRRAEGRSLDRSEVIREAVQAQRERLVGVERGRR